MRNKFLCAALLALLLALVGCGEKKDETVKLAFQAAPGYLQEEIALPVEAGELAGCCTVGDSIRFLVVPGADEEAVLCRASLDGKAEVLPEYVPAVLDGEPAAGYVGPVPGGDGKIWVWEQFHVFTYDLPPDFDPETGNKKQYLTDTSDVFRVRQLDPDTGAELSCVDVTAAMEELKLMSFSGVAADGEGRIYLSDSKRVLVLDGQGQILFTLKGSPAGNLFAGGAESALAALPDGRVAALTALPGGKREVRPIDAGTKDWGAPARAVQSGASGICSGSGGCEVFYTLDDTVYGLVPGEELPRRMLNWNDVRLENPSSVMGYALLEESRAMVLTSVQQNGMDRYSGHIQALRLEPLDEAPQDGRVKLVYGMIGQNGIVSQRIKKFNRENKEYLIEIRDYAEGMLSWGETDDTIYQGALTRMYAEFASGQVPDILGETLPLEGLARQGLLEDLWPWIEGDPDLGREKVMEHVLSCMEMEGKLYRICSGFAIETAVTSAAVAEGRTGWTMEEMLDAFGGQMPDLYVGGLYWTRLVQPYFNRVDRKSQLYKLTSMCLDEFVDWETGECSFDGEEFQSLLRMAGSSQEPTSAMDSADLEIWTLFEENRGIYRHDADVVEPCRVFPWEGGPVLYTRKLQEPKDLVLDDVLFSGPDGLTDYEQRLWDADILYSYVTDYGYEVSPSRYVKENYNFGRNAILSAMDPVVKSEREPIAADAVIGGADGGVYAAYTGLPSASGAGSSFSIYECMAISAGSGAKEGAWAFLRTLLLPEGNTVRADEPNVYPWESGFSMNRETLEQQLATEYFHDVETGENYLDPDGKPVEYSEFALGVGYPGDIILMACLLPPNDAQLDRFWRLYNAIDHITGENDDLLSIISEQAEPYFAGDKTLEETAQLIQNRAKLYVNENR